MTLPARTVRIDVGPDVRVSGLFDEAAAPRALMVLAHGAGAGMTHPFLAAVARGLAGRGISTLRYQFPAMERGSRRTDTPPVAQATVRAAVALAGQIAPGLPLVAGGKSFGGRMTSQAQAADPLPGVRALAFLGFPLHPAGAPSQERARHLSDVRVPMLFLQGTRDALADFRLVQRVVQGLAPLATLRAFEDADHSFHVPARTGRTDAQVHAALVDALADWIDAVARAEAGGAAA